MRVDMSSVGGQCLSEANCGKRRREVDRAAEEVGINVEAEQVAKSQIHAGLGLRPPRLVECLLLYQLPARNTQVSI